MINRRSITAGGLLAISAFGQIVRAEVACTPLDGNGVQICTAGIQLGRTRTDRQECKNWCWAACIQAIFRLNEKKVSQSRIVQKLFGDNVCSAAIGPQIVGVISGDWTTDDGEAFTALSEPLLDLQFGVANANAAAMVAQELGEGRPVINGALGHATILTAMTYYRDVFGRGIPQEIVVRDPWPRNPNRRVLSRQEASGTFFIAKVQIDS